MAKAYIALTRNDLEGNYLDIKDLQPNTAMRNLIYSPVGQTHYLQNTVQNDMPLVTGTNPGTTDADYYGLSAYLLDNVDAGAGTALLYLQAINAGFAILRRACSGLPLTLTAIDAILEIVNTGSTLTGGTSTGTLADVLDILSGKVWKLPAGVTVNDNGNFAGGGHGYFVQAPTQIATNAGPGGRSSFRLPTIPNEPITLGTNQDLTWRNIPTFVHTSDLELSCHSGCLSVLANSAYAFEDPTLSYDISSKGAYFTSAAAASGAATLVFAAGASVTDNAYNTMWAHVVSGVGAGQIRYIYDYTGGTLTCNVSPVWSTVPTSASTIRVYTTKPADLAYSADGYNVLSTTGRAVTVYAAHGTVIA